MRQPLYWSLILWVACGKGDEPKDAGENETGQQETGTTETGTTETGTTETGDTDPPEESVRFFVWDLPTDGELILQAGVQPYLHVKVRTGSQDLPEGFEVDGSLDPADQIASTFEAWIQAYQDAEPYASGEPLLYSIYPQNIGSEKDGWADDPLFHHSLDRVGEPPGDSEVHDARLGTPFMVNGVDGIGDWSESMLAHLKTRLDAAGLPGPYRLHLDMETSISPNDAAHQADGTPDGWWPLVLTDTRFGTEALVGTQTLSDLYGTSGLEPDYTKSIWHSENGDFVGWLYGVASQLRSEGMRLGLVESARVHWPELLSSNYNTICATQNHPDIRHKVHNRVTNVPEIPLDFQSPVLYPHGDNSYGEAGTKLNDHRAVLGLPALVDATTEDMRETYLAYAKRVIDNTLAACPNTPVAPWVGYPGWLIPLPGGRLGIESDHCYEVRKEEILEVMEYGQSQGIKEWLVWTGTPKPEECDGLALEEPGPVAKPSEEIWTEWVEILQALAAG